MFLPKAELHTKIREKRSQYRSHDQIIAELNLPRATYFRHIAEIKKEDQSIYGELAREDVRQELDRCRAGLEKDITELDAIANNAAAPLKLKKDAIYNRAELRIALARLLKDGVDVLDELGLRHKEANTSRLTSSCGVKYSQPNT